MSSRFFITTVAVLLLLGLVLSRLMAKAPAQMATSVEKAVTAAEQAGAPSATPAAASAAPSAATPVATPPASASTVAPALEAEFNSARADAMAAMPKQADLQKLSAEQAHFTPQSVINAASAIGRVSELVKEHPELSARGLDFYKACAEKETSPESLRASCLADFVRLQTKSGLSVPAPKVPARVAALADKILL